MFLGGNMKNFNKKSFRRDFNRSEKHKAICSECGKECEVPFKPTEGREVFCNECYSKRRNF